VAPTTASAYVPVAGEVGNNTGVFVKAILANPGKSQGRYVFVKTETTTHGGVVKAWEEVTGKKAQLIPTSKEAFANIWGRFGADWQTSMPGTPSILIGKQMEMTLFLWTSLVSRKRTSLI
jgi:hypothetical protein